MYTGPVDVHVIKRKRSCYLIDKFVTIDSVCTGAYDGVDVFTAGIAKPGIGQADSGETA